MLFEVNKAASDLLGTVAAGSDSDLTADLTINRVRWINSTRRLVLNRTGADAMATYWTDQPNSTTKSVYLLLDTDTLIEIVPAWFDRVFVAAVRWIIPTAEVDVIVALDDIIHGSTILMTVADAGSVDAIASGDSPVISLTAGETLPSGLALTAGVLSGTPDTLTRTQRTSASPPPRTAHRPHKMSRSRSNWVSYCHAAHSYQHRHCWQRPVHTGN